MNDELVRFLCVDAVFFLILIVVGSVIEELRGPPQ